MRDIITGDIFDSDVVPYRAVEWCGGAGPLFTALDDAAIAAATTVCAHCGKLTKKGTRKTVHKHRGEKEMWGRHCAAVDAVHLNDGRFVLPELATITIVNGARSIIHVDELDECMLWCDEHNIWHNEDECPLCAVRTPLFVEGYGRHGSFVVKEPRSFALGMEMEVADVNRDQFERVWGKLGYEFAYPTRDSSIGDRGIEFIGHPVDIMSHWSMASKYDLFFEGLSGASVSAAPCGCHTSVALKNFASEEAKSAAIIIANRFADLLIKWTHPSQQSRRASYANKAKLESGVPVDDAARVGKMTVANIKSREGLIEFRIAGMQLDTKRHLQQVTMYHNMVAWCNGCRNLLDACTASFEAIFGPFMFPDLLPREVGHWPIAPISFMDEARAYLPAGLSRASRHDKALYIHATPEDRPVLYEFEGSLFHNTGSSHENLTEAGAVAVVEYVNHGRQRFSVEPFSDVFGHSITRDGLYLNPKGNIILEVCDKHIPAEYKLGMAYVSLNRNPPTVGDEVFVFGSDLDESEMSALGYSRVSGVMEQGDVLFTNGCFRFVVYGLAGTDLSEFGSNNNLYRKET